MSEPAATLHSPFHPGEQAMQARAGMRERIEQVGQRIVRDFMPDQHRAFFAHLPFLVVGSLDGHGRPWASMLAGQPGFIASPDPYTLAVEALPLPGDPLAGNLRPGAPLGLLGIQLETRRRNRANGYVLATNPRGFTVRIEQSFGNCPKYIQPRLPHVVEATAKRPPVVGGPLLSPSAAALVAGADTFFIATAAEGGQDPTRGVDVSHRGGKPGFVRVREADGQSVLTIPDYQGNFLFNTFGNLAVRPAAGLLFVDFASGGLLCLTGTGEVLWDDPELATFEGAQRLLRFRLQQSLWQESAVPLRWTHPLSAPATPSQRIAS